MIKKDPTGMNRKRVFLHFLFLFLSDFWTVSLSVSLAAAVSAVKVSMVTVAMMS